MNDRIVLESAVQLKYIYLSACQSAQLWFYFAAIVFNGLQRNKVDGDGKRQAGNDPAGQKVYQNQGGVLDQTENRIKGQAFVYERDAGSPYEGFPNQVGDRVNKRRRDRVGNKNADCCAEFVPLTEGCQKDRDNRVQAHERCHADHSAESQPPGDLPRLSAYFQESGVGNLDKAVHE